MPRDIAARWRVPLSSGVYTVEFEHGTTTGGRAIFVNNNCIHREEFMFKLVGVEEFKLGDTPCCIRIEPTDGLSYRYQLFVNGKPFEKFTEAQSKVLMCWIFPLDGQMVRVALEKDSLDVFVNADRVETAGEFTDEGTETHFGIGQHSCFIKTVSSGRKRTGLVHSLFVDEHEVPAANVDQKHF